MWMCPNYNIGIHNLNALAKLFSKICKITTGTFLLHFVQINQLPKTTSVYFCIAFFYTYNGRKMNLFFVNTSINAIFYNRFNSICSQNCSAQLGDCTQYDLWWPTYLQLRVG